MTPTAAAGNDGGLDRPGPVTRRAATGQRAASGEAPAGDRRSSPPRAPGAALTRFDRR